LSHCVAAAADACPMRMNPCGLFCLFFEFEYFLLETGNGRPFLFKKGCCSFRMSVAAVLQAPVSFASVWIRISHGFSSSSKALTGSRT
jgi:hypothetical protein